MRKSDIKKFVEEYLGGTHSTYNSYKEWEDELLKHYSLEDIEVGGFHYRGDDTDDGQPYYAYVRAYHKDFEVQNVMAIYIPNKEEVVEILDYNDKTNKHDRILAHFQKEEHWEYGHDSFIFKDCNSPKFKEFYEKCKKAKCLFYIDGDHEAHAESTKFDDKGMEDKIAATWKDGVIEYNEHFPLEKTTNYKISGAPSKTQITDNKIIFGINDIKVYTDPWLGNSVKIRNDKNIYHIVADNNHNRLCGISRDYLRYKPDNVDEAFDRRLVSATIVPVRLDLDVYEDEDERHTKLRAARDFFGDNINPGDILPGHYYLDNLVTEKVENFKKYPPADVEGGLLMQIKNYQYTDEEIKELVLNSVLCEY